jgi:signal transduction histidine kinase
MRKALDFSDLELNIAGTRLVLSLLALISLYIDPSTAGGLFHLDRYALITLLCHLGYSATVYVALSRGANVRRIIAISTVFDLVFATAIASLTEGQTSPSYVFFMFAITAVGIRASLRPTVLVTLCSVVLYLLTVALSDGLHNYYIMRAVYLAIAGYLVGFFGWQKNRFETRARELESAAERLSIARSLHDSYVQALAAVNLRLESCGELLRRGQIDDAVRDLKELQVGVAREYDEVRAYIRTLASVDPPASQTTTDRRHDPQTLVRAEFSASALIGEHILQIMAEGLRNARRHAMAKMVKIEVSNDGDKVRLMITDDGIGFPQETNPPWAIASRVAEFGGRLNINGTGSSQLEIEVPRNLD